MAGNTSVATASTTVNLNRAPVLDPIGARQVEENAALFFAVTAHDPDGTTPTISAQVLPAGASLQGGIFAWTPGFEQAGSYLVTFRASDGDLEALEAITITVGNVNRAPTVPVMQQPRTQSEVQTLQPALVLENSIDPDGDPLTYEYELYADAGLTNLLAEQAGVIAGVPVTAWTVPMPLDENVRYWWRGRASDQGAVSQWTEEGNFFVNTVNDPPGSPTTTAPPAGAEAATLTPELRVDNASDPDGDTLTYAFEVAADPAMTVRAAAVADLAPGQQGSTGWTVDQSLSENTWYWWRAIAKDQHGAATASPTASFFVNVANDAPSAPGISSPANEVEIASASVALTVTNATDPDHDVLDYAFELDTVNTFDGPAVQRSAAIPEGSGTTSWAVAGLLENTQYWWRARAGDGQAAGNWALGNFFVNAGNDPPTLPAVRNPGAGAWVDSVTPRLEVVAAADPDRDVLGYEFEVALGGVPWVPVGAGSSPTTDWTVAPALADNTWHAWRARAVDEHGLPGPWTAATEFFVNNNGVDDPPSITMLTPASDTVVTGDSYTIQWADADPDSSAVIGLYRDTDSSGLDGTLIAGGLQEDPDGAGDAYLWDLGAVPAGRYWLYGVISVAPFSRSSYSLGALTVDKQAPQATASPGAGTYAGSVTVSLSATDDTDGAPVIRYSVDGSTPTLQSPVYGGPLSFTATTTLRFFATDAAGRQQSVQGPYLYTIVPASYTVTPSAGSNGSISPSTPQSVGYNQTAAFTVTPNNGYLVGSVSGCGGALVGSVYTSGPITANCTVAASFSLYPAVTVLAPNGGEVLASGSSSTIRWGAPATAVKFDLSYSTNNGSSYTSIATGATGYSYNWTVPKPTANSTQCLVKVVGKTSSGSTVGTDVSNAVFTIEVVRVMAPNGGETIHRQSTPTTPITWVTNTASQTPNKSTLSYSTNGGSNWTQITTIASNPGTYTWTVPSANSSQYRVKVEIFRDSTALGSDTSNANFTVTYP
jgi:hypothetical protein